MTLYLRIVSLGLKIQIFLLKLSLQFWLFSSINILQFYIYVLQFWDCRISHNCKKKSELWDINLKFLLVSLRLHLTIRIFTFTPKNYCDNFHSLFKKIYMLIRIVRYKLRTAGGGIWIVRRICNLFIFFHDRSWLLYRSHLHSFIFRFATQEPMRFGFTNVHTWCDASSPGKSEYMQRQVRSMKENTSFK